MSSNDSKQSKRVGVQVFWPILLVVFLALLVFLVMSRPCEWFRLRFEEVAIQQDRAFAPRCFGSVGDLHGCPAFSPLRGLPN